LPIGRRPAPGGSIESKILSLVGQSAQRGLGTRELQAAARAVGQQIQIVGISSKRGFDAALTNMRPAE
jgi:hypothetical protein